MFDRALISPLSFLVKLQVFSLHSAYNFTKRWTPSLVTCIFQGLWQLSRNTYLKEHLWTAALKETDDIKNTVKIHDFDT